jgi:hypothetical protein
MAGQAQALQSLTRPNLFPPLHTSSHKEIPIAVGVTTPENYLFYKKIFNIFQPGFPLENRILKIYMFDLYYYYYNKNDR